MSSCGWAFSPSTWEERQQTRALPNETIICDRPVPDGAEHCKYHENLRGTESVEISPEQAFEDLLEEDKPVFGARFDSLRFDDLEISREIDSAYIKNAIFISKFEVNKLKQDARLRFDGCVFDRTDIKNAECSNWLEFYNCHIRQKSRFRGFSQTEKLDFRKTTFEKETWVAGDFNEQVGIVGSNFKQGLLIKNSKFNSLLNLRGTEIQGDLFIHKCDINEGLRMDESNPGNRIYITESSLSNFNCTFDTNQETLILCYGSEVHDSVLSQPSGSKTHFDLTNSTLGDVRIRPEAPLDRYYFNETNYDGFAFYDHRSVFRKENWRIHRFNPDLPDSYFREYSDIISSITPPPIPNYDHDTDLKDCEETYLLARKAAFNQGDNRSGSSLYIVEMKARKERHRDAALCSNNVTGWSAGRELYHWVKNVFHHRTSVYGERPSLPIILSVGLTFLWAGFYTIFGKLDINDSVFLSTIVNSDKNTTLLETFGHSLYYSATTFTTIGSSYTPVDTVTKVATAVESFVGAFLLALLVFTLGRQISR